MGRKLYAVTALAALCAACLIGCPPGTQGKSGQVCVLLTADDDASKALVETFLKAGEVDIEEIQALYVDVTMVELIPASEDESEDGEDPDEGEELSGAKQAQEEDGEQQQDQDRDRDNTDHVFISPNLEQLDLMKLQGEAAVLSLADVTPGDYNKLNLSIANPLLVFKPETEGEDPVSTTDIHLTANSRLFITQPFTIEEGQQLLALDLNGLKIVEKGNGGYVWTPQLDMSLNFTDVNAEASGIVEEIFADDTFDLILPDDTELYVDASAATVLLPEGSETTLDSLSAGDDVRVEGVMFIDGKLEATLVEIVSQAPAA